MNGRYGKDTNVQLFFFFFFHETLRLSILATGSCLDEFLSALEIIHDEFQLLCLRAEFGRFHPSETAIVGAIVRNVETVYIARHISGENCILHIDCEDFFLSLTDYHDIVDNVLINHSSDTVLDLQIDHIGNEDAGLVACGSDQHIGDIEFEVRGIVERHIQFDLSEISDQSEDIGDPHGINGGNEESDLLIGRVREDPIGISVETRREKDHADLLMNLIRDGIDRISI